MLPTVRRRLSYLPYPPQKHNLGWRAGALLDLLGSTGGWTVAQSTLRQINRDCCIAHAVPAAPSYLFCPAGCVPVQLAFCAKLLAIIS